MTQKIFYIFMAVIISACGVKGPPEPPLITEANSRQQMKSGDSEETIGSSEVKSPAPPAATPQVFPTSSSQKTLPPPKKKKK